MKKIFLPIIAISIFFCLSMAKRPKRIVFFGDSITQAAVQPNGYILQLDSMLKNEGHKDASLLGKGISGNKVYDLYLRIEEDVLAQRPDFVFIYVGVNDVWHKSTHRTGTDLDKFEKFYRAMILKMVSAGIQPIPCTMAVIGEKTDGTNPEDKELDAYAAAIRKLATEYKLPLVDLRNDFLAYNKLNNLSNAEKGILTTDRVHLNSKGNEMVANAMANVLKTLW